MQVTNNHLKLPIDNYTDMSMMKTISQLVCLFMALCFGLPSHASASPFENLGEMLQERALVISPREEDPAINKIQSYVRERILIGVSAKDGCNEALKKYGSSELEYSIAACEYGMRPDEDEFKNNKDRINKDKAKLNAASNRNDEINKMRSGTKQISTFEDAVAVYDAIEGISLASAPKIKPDGKLYYLAGIIDQPTKNSLAFIAKANNGVADLFKKALSGRGEGEPKYFYVRLNKSMEKKYYDLAKIGLGFDIVGKYVGNTDYQTVLGQTKSMPVFDGIYFEFWDSKKLQ